MANSSFFGTPAFTSFRHLVHSALLFIITCAKSLECHKTMDHRDAEFFCFYGNKVSVFIVLGSYFNIVINGVNSAVDKDA
jgi:hypothetical protein